MSTDTTTSRLDREVDCYFDFISPFAYLQAEILAREPLPARVSYKPVLFAGLLKQWGQLGPAEIVPKRRFTFRYCMWKAHQLGIPMRLPPMHPFNPLPLLRLAIALDCAPQACLTLFRFVFQQGRSAEDPAAWRDLLASLDAPDAAERIARADVKDGLRRNTEAAIARGVFGVPTLAVDTELFWGADATQMCRDYLTGDRWFSGADATAVDRMPEGVQRQRP